MGQHDQLLEMLKTIDDTENYLRRRCLTGTAAQSASLFQDLSSLIDMIQHRFRGKGVLPPIAPSFRADDGAQTAEMFLDEVAGWVKRVRERIQQKNVLQELSRGSLLDALDKEGKPFVETAKALRAMRPKSPADAAQPADEAAPPAASAPYAGEEKARRAFAEALAKSPAAAAFREQGADIISSIRTAPNDVKPTPLPSQSQIDDLSGVAAEQIGGRTVIRPVDDDETDDASPPALQPPTPELTPRERRAQQMAQMRKPPNRSASAARPMTPDQNRNANQQDPAQPPHAARPMAPDQNRNTNQQDPAQPPHAARPMAPDQNRNTNQQDPAQPPHAARPMAPDPNSNTRQQAPTRPPRAARPMAAEQKQPPTLEQIKQGNHQIHNDVDMQMFQLLDEIAEKSTDQIFLKLKKEFPNLESRYKMVITDFSRRYSYWGSINAENKNYSLLQNRAEQLGTHVDDFRWLYTVLGDYRSKKTLLALLANWYDFNFKLLSDVKEKIFAPYFDLDIIKCDNNEHFVDVGAYIGEVTEAFVNTYGNYDKITCYEMTAQSFMSLEANTKSLERVSIYNLGVHDRAGQMFIGSRSADPSTNYLAESGDTPVETVSLDAHLTSDPTFLKINAEGCETAVLQGAANTIRRCHPKIAVRADHSNDAIWALAKTINSIDARYRFYLRHHGGNLIPAEYVLIAV